MSDLEKMAVVLRGSHNLSLQRLGEIANETAIQKGFWSDPNIGEKIALVHSELSEALEADRKRDKANFKEELADAVIRILDLAEHLDIDLYRAIANKMAVNIDRPYKHGKKY